MLSRQTVTVLHSQEAVVEHLEPLCRARTKAACTALKDWPKGWLSDLEITWWLEVICEHARCAHTI